MPKARNFANRDALLIKRRPKGSKLSPHKAAHFTHIADIARRRFSIRTWFKRELVNQGLGKIRLNSAELTRELEKIKSTLPDEMEKRIMNEVMNIARIGGKKREILLRLSSQVTAETNSLAPEGYSFVRAFLTKLKGNKSFRESERKRLQNAFFDWDHAIHFPAILQEYDTTSDSRIREHFDG